MNTIEECVYNREPAQSQLRLLRRQAAEKAQWQRDYEQLMGEHREVLKALHVLMRAIDSVTMGQEEDLRKEWEPKARALLKRLGNGEGLR